jgi:NO-binding membrane sensor protein with MHYT domain
MHYLGMEAMVLDGYIKWNPGVIAASVIIAIIAVPFT